MSAARDGLGGDGAGGLAVGVDVGGTKVHGVLLDGDTVVGSVRLPARRGPEGVVGTVVEAVERLCVDAGVVPGELAGVGVGVPGLVDPATGSVVHAVNLGLHDDVVLGPEVERRLGAGPVQVENDLNVAALGAARLLGLGGDLAYLALGTGVAAGLVLDGRLRRGYAGAAGEVGHLPYVPDGPVCACGQRGCLELYASGSALGAAFAGRARALGVGDAGDGAATSNGDGRAASSPAARAFRAAQEGDPAAVRTIEAFGDAVAAAVRHVVLGCDVEHVVLGGGVAEVGAPLLVLVTEALERQAGTSGFLRRLRMADRLVLAPHGALVAPVGAALAVRERPHRPTEVAPWRS
ncbi:ROK family protein [Actinotalea solisilvae]|uniref:ROK family protein n=1 Tax=Actinotalea solisilvae TaxID=2072922 RepID=UPI0027DCF1CB|nr:ROK family protein [Actinotalea solisilvae]